VQSEPKGLETVFSAEQIQERIDFMAREISNDYAGETIHAIGILEAGFIFLADLVRRVSSPVVCHFLKMDMVDSQPSGHQPLRNIVYGTLGEVTGNHLLLVDTMVDSGITLDHLMQQLLIKRPKSLRTAALVDRKDRRRVALPLAYVGFTWEGGHLVGYGLDHNGLYRNLPYIASMSSDSRPKQAGSVE
jgi:hypoxanthine phosphoribosyltransferase